MSKYFGFFAPYTQTASSSLLHVVYELKREEMHLNDPLGVFFLSVFFLLILRLQALFCFEVLAAGVRVLAS